MEYIDQGWQNQRQQIVPQMQILCIDQVARYQSAAEQRRKKDISGKETAEPEILPCQGECHHRDEQRSQKGSDHCDENGDQICVYNGSRIFKQIRVCRQIKFLWYQSESIACQIHLIGEGCGNDNQKRNQTRKPEQDKEEMYPGAGFFFGRNGLVSAFAHVSPPPKTVNFPVKSFLR